MDFTKTCWYCGKNEMEPFDSYYCCANCGATWNEVPKIGVGVVVVEKDEGTGGTKYRPSKRMVIGVGKKIRRVRDATKI